MFFECECVCGCVGVLVVCGHTHPLFSFLLFLFLATKTALKFLPFCMLFFFFCFFLHIKNEWLVVSKDLPFTSSFSSSFFPKGVAKHRQKKTRVVRC